MNHLEVIDTPTTALHDEQIIKDDAELAKNMGFTGKAVIHPKHIDIVRKAFLPTKEEISEALDIVNRPCSYVVTRFAEENLKMMDTR